MQNFESLNILMSFIITEMNLFGYLFNQQSVDSQSVLSEDSDLVEMLKGL